MEDPGLWPPPPSHRLTAPRTCSWISCRTQRTSDEVSTPGPGQEEGTALLPAMEAVLTPILKCTDLQSSPGLGTRARSRLTPQEPIISLILGAHSYTVLHRHGVFWPSHRQNWIVFNSIGHRWRGHGGRFRHRMTGPDHGVRFQIQVFSRQATDLGVSPGLWGPVLTPWLPYPDPSPCTHSFPLPLTLFSCSSQLPQFPSPPKP